jgi:hypothetical protein
MKKRTISKKTIIIAAVCLLIIAVVCAVLNSSAHDGNETGCSLTITRNGETVKTFSLEEIKEMKSVTVKKSIESTSHDDESGSYTGVPLEDILDQADDKLLSQCGTFVTLAGDSFSSALSAEDIKKKDNVIVVYEKDGKDLVPFTKGGSGPMQIIVQSDDYGNRCTKYLIRVECQ